MNDLATAELALPWADRADAHCFGCSPANPVGLGLRFRPDFRALIPPKPVPLPWW